MNVQHVSDSFPLDWEDLGQTTLPPSPAHFYLCGDEDRQLREAVLGDEEQGDATYWFPFSPLFAFLISNSAIIISLLWSKTASQPWMDVLELLMNVNVKGTIRGILTVTNFKCIVSYL